MAICKGMYNKGFFVLFEGRYILYEIFSIALQDMLLGDHCRFDICGGLSAWDSGEWVMKCCNNKAALVKQPPDGISNEQTKKVG